MRPYITATTSKNGRKVHAYILGNKGTLCSAKVYDFSHAEYIPGHRDNCKTCERQVQRELDNG